MYPSMARKCVCALRLRTAGGVDFCVILPPPPLPHLMLSTLPLPLSLSLSLCLRLPPILCSLPPFSPVSGANTVPCRVGHVMKKWLVRALRRTSYFIISRAFLPFTVRWLSPPLFLPLSPLLFLSLFRLLPSFCSSHTQGGDLSSARGKKRKKVCCYFYSQGLPTARPSIDGAFFSLTTSWILTLCLQQLCETWQQVAFYGPFRTFGA